MSNTKDDKSNTYVWPVNAATGAPSYFVSLLQICNIRHAVETLKKRSDVVVLHVLFLEFF